MSGAPETWSLVLTSEHGGNDVPTEFRTLFQDHRETLRSHRGWDPGTLVLTDTLAARLDAPSITSRVTRLLVDLNRSPHNPRTFSMVSRPLPRNERLALLERYHRPHWDRVRAAISHGVAHRRRVLHLGIHSFTPVLDGAERTADLALLYDPSRPRERALAQAWATALSEALPDRVVRRNYPYRGAADGLTTALRRSFVGERYLGLEVEVNQRHVRRDGSFPAWVADALVSTLPPEPGR